MRAGRWQPGRVFFLGPEGTFSHILAAKRFGKSAELRKCRTIESVVEGALADPDAAGLIPVENSSGGTVPESVDVLIRHAGRLAVIEELALDVRIALLSRHGGPLLKIYSHFTQIRHHADWLRARHPKARLIAVESTAEAARRAARSAGAGALASPGAAEIYGLGHMEWPPAPGTANVTHFFVVRAGEPAAATPGRALKTALVAALPNVCGSLHAFLGPFARNGISLSRIVSRPVPGKPRTYVFFLEIEAGEAEPAAAKALAQARRRAEFLRSLGSFPRGGRRFKS